MICGGHLSKACYKYQDGDWHFVANLSTVRALPASFKMNATTALIMAGRHVVSSDLVSLDGTVESGPSLLPHVFSMFNAGAFCHDILEYLLYCLYLLRARIMSRLSDSDT